MAALASLCVACGSDDKKDAAEAGEATFVQFEDSNWTSFGHDLFNTRHNPVETAITRDTVGRLEVAWSRPDVEVTSTPAVVDGVVYYGDWSGKLHAVNATDGSEVWSIQLSQGPVQCSPLVTDDRVYIGDMRAVFHSVDRATGSVEWSQEVDDHPNANFTGSAVKTGDHILVGVASGELGESKDDYTFRGQMVSLDAGSGNVNWRVYMTEDDETSGAGVSVWSSPAVDEERGVMYVGTGNTYEPPASPRSDSVVAIEVESGEVQWVSQFTEGDVYVLLQPPPQGPDADIGAAPNLFEIEGRDVLGVGDKAGVYAVLDRDTGEELWATQLTNGSHLGGVMVAAAYAQGAVYVASNLWPKGFDTENIFIPDFDDPDNTSVVFRLDAKTGEKMWETAVPSPTLGAMAVAGGVVYTGESLGMLRALDTDTGEVLWSHQTGATMASGQTISEGRVFAGYGFSFIGITGGEGDQKGGLTAYALP